MAREEGEQCVRSLPNIVAPSDCVRHTSNISDSEFDVSSEYEDKQSSSDNKSWMALPESHFHEGIDLTGDEDNSVGIIHNFDDDNPIMMLSTPSEGKMSLVVGLN